MLFNLHERVRFCGTDETKTKFVCRFVWLLDVFGGFVTDPCVADDQRVYGFVRMTSGDELSVRAKFVLITWVGRSVSVVKRAKVSTDKAFVKQVIMVSLPPVLCRNDALLLACTLLITVVASAVGVSVCEDVFISKSIRPALLSVGNTQAAKPTHAPLTFACAVLRQGDSR
jgi:hypothetical protein